MVALDASARAGVNGGRVTIPPLAPIPTMRLPNLPKSWKLLALLLGLIAVPGVAHAAGVLGDDACCSDCPCPCCPGR